MPKEEPLEVSFPLGGVDVAGEFSVQRPNTSADALNVRALDPLEERLRGGSRHGLIKYPNQRVPAGVQLIQHLNQIVLVSGDFLAVTFQDYEPDFIPNTSTTDTTDTEIPPEGSGVQPYPGYPANPRRRIAAVPSQTTAINETTVTITSTLTRQTAGTLLSGQTLVLTTNPPGKDGDGDTAVTNGSGVATFTVSEATFEGQIQYTVYNEYDTP